MGDPVAWCVLRFHAKTSESACLPAITSDPTVWSVSSHLLTTRLDAFVPQSVCTTVLLVVWKRCNDGVEDLQ